MKVKCNALFDVKFLGDVQINSSIIKEKTITAEGTYNASDDGADGYNPVTVNIPLQEKTVTANGAVTPDEGYAGLSKVSVNVPDVIPEGYIKPEAVRAITENGTYDVTEYKTVQVIVETGEDTEMVYTFKDEPAFPLGQITQDINFTSNGTRFVKMQVEPYEIRYITANGVVMVVYSEHDISTPEYGHWEHGDWKTVNLGTGEQTMDAEFYEWFIANVIEGAKMGLIVLQSKSVTPTTSEQTVTPDSGYDGLSKVVVGAVSSSGGSANLGTLNITTPNIDGTADTYNASDKGYDGFASVTVEPLDFEDVEITSNGTYHYVDLTGTGNVFPRNIKVNVESSGGSSSGTLPTCKIKFSSSALSNWGMSQNGSPCPFVDSEFTDYSVGQKIKVYNPSTGTFSMTKIVADTEYTVVLGTIIDKGCYSTWTISGGSVTEYKYGYSTGDEVMYRIDVVASNIGATITFGY